MPTSRSTSAAFSRSDSLNASACASDVSLWRMVRSSAVAFKLPLASRLCCTAGTGLACYIAVAVAATAAALC
eukprot:5088615-Pleurochrysis_carterae.AAC.1